MSPKDTEGLVVLDTAALLAAMSLEPGRVIVPSTVMDEIRDGGTVPRRLNSLIEAGARILDPTPEQRHAMWDAAEASGDGHVLSPTDVDVVALAKDHGATVLSDDYAVQNLCHHVEVQVEGVTRKTARKRTWTVATCTGCRAEHKLPAPQECPVCGAPVKRGRPKRRD